MAKAKQVGRGRPTNKVPSKSDQSLTRALAKSIAQAARRAERAKQPEPEATTPEPEVKPEPEVTTNPLKELEATIAAAGITPQPEPEPEPRRVGRPRKDGAEPPRAAKVPLTPERIAELIAQVRVESTPMTEARVIAAALAETGWSRAELARRAATGKLKAMWDRVIYRTELLDLPPEYQEAAEKGELSELEAWYLGRVPVDNRETFVARIAADKALPKRTLDTVAALRQLADSLTSKAA
jgi:hypothetical protein